MFNNDDENKEYLYRQMPGETTRQTVERNYRKYVANGSKPKQSQQTSPWYRKTYDKVWNETNKLHDEPMYDKYKHAVVSCIGAQNGLSGATVTGVMGVGKEIKDLTGRKFSRQASGKQDYGGYLSIIGNFLRDLVADGVGIYTGYFNNEGNCYDMIKPFYSPNEKNK